MTAALRAACRSYALLLAAALLAAGVWPSAAQQPIEARITFLHANDVYQISPRRGLGGFGPLMTLIRQERTRSPLHVLTFGGDLISPSLLSGVTKGAHMIELLNTIGADLAVLGNHEFDFGLDVLRQRVAESRFEWLGANVRDASGALLPGVSATAILRRGPVTIGFFGLITPEARVYIRGSMPVSFRAFMPYAREAVDRLKRQGAQLIVALTHMTLAEDRELVRELRGLHLVLGGHDHIPITVYERGTLILKAGTDAEFLGAIDLDVTIEGERVSAIPSWRLVPVHRVKGDETVQAIVRRHEQALDQELAVPIGSTATELDSRTAAVREGESAIGNLIADALRERANADAAMMNGGGIRGSKLYPSGSTISGRDIFSELPFGNIAVVVEAKGGEIRAMIEHGLALSGLGAGGFPHVSGLAISYDPSAPKGQRVRTIAIGGAPLEAERTYRLATSDFIASGGDGYAMLMPLKRILDETAGPLLAQVVIDYVVRKGTVAPRIEGRLRATQ